MKMFLNGVLKVNKFMQVIAGVFLSFIVALTTVDVLGRLVGHPIPGAVEVIAMCGGIVIGFTVPITSWMKGHISVDFLLNVLPAKARNAVDVVTRCAGITMFTIIGWNLMKVGAEFRSASEVSGTLELPLYPIVWGIGIGMFMLALVLLCDIFKMFGGSHE